jgi:hypothetical protein
VQKSSSQAEQCLQLLLPNLAILTILIAPLALTVLIALLNYLTTNQTMHNYPRKSKNTHAQFGSSDKHNNRQLSEQFQQLTLIALVTYANNP